MNNQNQNRSLVLRNPSRSANARARPSQRRAQVARLLTQARNRNGNGGNGNGNGRSIPGGSKRTSGTIAMPAGMVTAANTSQPKFNRGSKSCRIVHRELVSSILGTDVFGLSKLSINPGLVAAFPWLASQAANWEQYSFNRLSYHFYTRVGTGVFGSLMIAPDYDAADASPLTETQLCAYEDAVEDVVWRDQECKLDIAAMHSMGPRKFVRNTTVANQDIKTFDVGNLFIGTIGMSALIGAICGKLWVDYDVTFFVPQIPSDPGLARPTRASWFQMAADQVLTTTVPATVILDGATYDPLGFGPAVAGSYTPAAGTYLIDFQCQPDGGSASAIFSLNPQKNANGILNTAQVWSLLAGAEVLSRCQMIVSFNGTTDTFRVRCTLSGAGALQLNQQTTQMVVSLV